MKNNFTPYIKSFLIISIAIFIILSVFPSRSMLSNISTSATLTMIVFGLYVNLFWRYNPFEKVPKLKKNYEGIMISDYDGEKRKISLSIKQNLFFVTIVLISDESRSNALMSDIVMENGDKLLIYYYINNPKSMVRHRSEIHYGISRLVVNDPEYLTGQYFTDRKTLGDIELFAKL